MPTKEAVLALPARSLRHRLRCRPRRPCWLCRRGRSTPRLCGRTTCPPTRSASKPWASCALDRRGRQQVQALQARADLRALVLIRLDEREPQPADLVAEQVERGLDLDRAGDDADELVRGCELLVDLARAFGVAGA